WADALILERLKGNARPEDTITHSLAHPSDWGAFTAKRAQRDAEIEAWAIPLTDSDLTGTIVWYPGDGATRVQRPKALCAAELFQHQTHHRGQIHAMLTAAGARTAPTNLSMLP
ncbi:MAG: DinB family protein, partial [Pseudomonadota bacterium]